MSGTKESFLKVPSASGWHINIDKWRQREFRYKKIKRQLDFYTNCWPSKPLIHRAKRIYCFDGSFICKSRCIILHQKVRAIVCNNVAAAVCQVGIYLFSLSLSFRTKPIVYSESLRRRRCNTSLLHDSRLKVWPNPNVIGCPIINVPTYVLMKKCRHQLQRRRTLMKIKRGSVHWASFSLGKLDYRSKDKK